MWEKMAKRAVSLETRSYFFVFWTVFSETRPTKLAVFTCYLGIKAWNTEVVFIETRGFCCGGIHWNQGILASPKPLVSMKPPQQNPWFQWNHPRFQAFNPKTRETANFRRPSFTETVPKKKWSVSLLKHFSRDQWIWGAWTTTRRSSNLEEIIFSQKNTSRFWS